MKERVVPLLYKSRKKPAELIILESLKHRMQLSNNDRQNYYNLNKGYEGELLFDSLTEQIEGNCLILNDLRLTANNQNFQIDALLISKNTLYIFEVKNYSRDYYYTSDKILKNDQSEVTNPLIQLQRAESLLRQLLLKFNFSIPIQSYVIFVNPEFMLYLAPPDKPFIFPTQLNRFLKKLNNDQSQIQQHHMKLAETIKSLDKLENPYQYLPHYDYQQLRKGMICAKCNSFSLKIAGMKCICTSCGNTEHIDIATIRTINEFKLLFPNEKITTGKIFEWCDIITSKKRIQRILKTNFKQMDVLRRVYYE